LGVMAYEFMMGRVKILIKVTYLTKIFLASLSRQI